MEKKKIEENFELEKVEIKKKILESLLEKKRRLREDNDFLDINLDQADFNQNQNYFDVKTLSTRKSNTRNKLIQEGLANGSGREKKRKGVEKGPCLPIPLKESDQQDDIAKIRKECSNGRKIRKV
ncbi:hypothetical protein HK099_008402 [Clydaea vesicula]|uniref:Uncharacterized protein n=1 Tax=Clydaea vesicula TaxID=447962 RepID=A0AAD5XT62_9FUNG|nr:hypothetical protein HK099_008402 [Clydaea vesicula]